MKEERESRILLLVDDIRKRTSGLPFERGLNVIEEILNNFVKNLENELSQKKESVPTDIFIVNSFDEDDLIEEITEKPAEELFIHPDIEEVKTRTIKRKAGIYRRRNITNKRIRNALRTKY